VAARLGAPAAWICDGGFRDRAPGPGPALDLGATWGAASGAAGVLGCAAAVAWLDAGRPGPVAAVVAGDTSAGVQIDRADAAVDGARVAFGDVRAAVGSGGAARDLTYAEYPKNRVAAANGSGAS
jgi:hypothetical protein